MNIETVRQGTAYEKYANPFARDGVVHIPQAFSARDLALIQAAYDWKLSNPGPGGQWLYPESGAKFLQAGGYSVDQPDFVRVLRDTPAAEIASALFGGGPVWFIGEQLFYKDGGSPTGRARRTPWHQDSSYLPFNGSKIAVLWIALDDVPRESALEVVRGSHLGVTYNASSFDDIDDTAPLYADSEMPRLPDIEADRSKWDIVGEAAQPGDVLVFHTAALHGGGATAPGRRRRSLTLRFIGDDVISVTRPAMRTDSQLAETLTRAREPGAEGVDALTAAYAKMEPGELLHRAGLAQVRPWSL